MIYQVFGLTVFLVGICSISPLSALPPPPTEPSTTPFFNPLNHYPYHKCGLNCWCKDRHHSKRQVQLYGDQLPCTNCVCPHPDSPDITALYCVEDNQCVAGNKCAASGRPEYGMCRPDHDPTGKYCGGTSDCKWYLMERCSDQGECIRPFARSSQQ